VAAAKSTGDTAARDTRGSDASAGPSADTIARLEAELSLLREQKAQAEESARLAAADAAMARNEKDEATATADAATRDIVRLKEGRLAPSLFEDRETVVPLAAAALAILWFGLWLGSYVSRLRAERAAASEEETAELVEAMSLAAATDQPVAAAEQAAPNIDQDSLVRELGKELGLAEVTAPPIADAILLPDNSLAPAPSQQEPAAPPVAAAVAPEAPVISIAAAPSQPNGAEAVATVQATGDVRSSPQAA